MKGTMMNTKRPVMGLSLVLSAAFAGAALAGDLEREAKFQQLTGDATRTTIGDIDEDSADLEALQVNPVSDAEANDFLARAAKEAPRDVLEALAGAFRTAGKLVRTPGAGDATLLWPFSRTEEKPVTLTRFYNHGQALEYGAKIDARLDIEGQEAERNKFKANLLQAVIQRDVSKLDLELYKDINAALVAVQVRGVSGKRWVEGRKTYLGDNDDYTKEAQEELHYQMVTPDGQIYVPASAAAAEESSLLRFLPNPMVVVPGKEVKKGETWQSRPLTGHDHQFLAGCKIQYTYYGIKRRLGGWFGWLFGWGYLTHYVQGRIVDQAGTDIGKVESYIDTVSGQLLEEFVKFDRRDFVLNGKKARARLYAWTWFLKTLKPGEQNELVPKNP